jgi:gamma-glutamyltranspeptidase/glutathione hydrolase
LTITAAFLAGALLAPAGWADTPPKLTQASVDGTRQVWISVMPQLPEFSPGPGDDFPVYGAEYPLVLRPDSSPQGPDYGSRVARMQASGFTGAHYLVYQNEDPTSGAHFWPDADPTWSSPDPSKHFSIAPEMFPDSDGNTDPDHAVRQIVGYVAEAKKHPSAAKVSGKFLIYAYGYGATGSYWGQVCSALSRRGVEVFIACILPHLPDSAAHIAADQSYLPSFDAVWNFDVFDSAGWARVIQLCNDNHKTYTGGMLAGSDRETSSDGAYQDAQGTAVFRQEWDRVIASGLQWNNIPTWNDNVEQHDVQPSSNWNWTRADINAFYSAKLRGVSPPSQLLTPQLYVTSPMQVHLGQASQAEALVLNTGPRTLTASIQLRDGAGRNYGRAVAVAVAAHQANAATIGIKLSSFPAGRFLRAWATMRDDSGLVVQQVKSAPVVVYGASEYPDPFLSRIMYYSVPARHALSGRVGLTLSGNPVTGSGAAGTVVPPAGTQVRFAEVLQNTREVPRGASGGQFLQNSACRVALPLTNGQNISGWQKICTTASGFYVARVINQNENVGYSDPVFIDSQGKVSGFGSTAHSAHSCSASGNDRPANPSHFTGETSQ